MTPQDLQNLITAALASGCGVLISALYQLYIDNINPQPTPLASRLTVFVLCILAPTLLYGAGVGFGWWPYDLATNLADVVAAFSASTLFHGLTSLSGTSAPPQTTYLQPAQYSTGTASVPSVFTGPNITVTTSPLDDPAPEPPTPTITPDGHPSVNTPQAAPEPIAEPAVTQEAPQAPPVATPVLRADR